MLLSYYAATVVHSLPMDIVLHCLFNQCILLTLSLVIQVFWDLGQGHARRDL